jgi:hypothetical protein
MPPEDSSVPATRPGRRRHWLPLVLAVLVVLVALAAFAMRRNASSAAKPEDCETKPPPNTFAVAECDDGTGAAGTKRAAPASHAPAAKP